MVGANSKQLEEQRDRTWPVMVRTPSGVDRSGQSIMMFVVHRSHIHWLLVTDGKPLAPATVAEDPSQHGSSTVSHVS